MILFDEVQIQIGIQESETLATDERKRLLRKLRNPDFRTLLSRAIMGALPQDIVHKLEVKVTQ